MPQRQCGAPKPALSKANSTIINSSVATAQACGCPV
jgi:hypothetical protein